VRAIKTAWEIDQLRLASEKVLASMNSVFRKMQPGMTKAEVIRLTRQEEAMRDLTYEYCWLSVGPSLNRTASDQPLVEGAPISIDSGANLNGYVGDVARMAVLGDPCSELIGLLDAIEDIQQTAFAKIKPGATGEDIHRAAEERLSASTIGTHSHFVAHGMGLITHEAPRLTSRGPIRYEGYDAHNPLEPGMVISVETTVADPIKGAVKLEDSLVITDDGFAFLGEGLRGWNRAGV
jgi:Xaa-Pro aminopeptidase